MPKTAPPYPALLAVAAMALLLLQIQVNPLLISAPLTRDLDMVSYRWSMVLASVALGLIAVPLGGKSYWHMPAIYFLMLTLASLFGLHRISLHLLEYGILALLVLLAALLAYRENITLLIALLLAKNFALWRFTMIYPVLPHHAFLFICTANFIFYAAALQALGMGLGLIFDWWPMRYLRLAGAAMITGSMLTYFYTDMHNFAARMLY